MCRLFGMLSVKPRAVTGYLIEDIHSLLKQADADPSRLQEDGWGISHMDGHMRSIKSTGAVFREPGLFGQAAEGIESALVLAHIRRASNPLGIDKNELMTESNIQPFLAPGFAFIHNGTVNHPDRVDLGGYREMLGGKNDSEVLFWLLIKNLEGAEDAGRALAAAEAELLRSAEKADAPFTSINMIFTDGSTLHAYCRYTAQDGTSLFSANRGYYTMHYLPGKDCITVMSEPSDDSGGWIALGDRELLTARLSGETVVHSVQKLNP